MTIHQILKHYWGHSQFRPLQEDIIQSVLDGKDTLALLPTGGGKSICFQVPTLSQNGICIVVSPLIALMKDQVENLRARGIESVAIFSGMGKREIDIILDNCVYGPVKFLYLSPERLMTDLVRERIKYMNVSLFAIDEAHCISQWGYDFRPPYLQLAGLRELHPDVPILALTATATGRVVEDIQDKLAFKERNVFRKSFERKNLAYVVSDDENKLRKLFTIVKRIKGSGIVYVRNRRETQEVSRLLNREGVVSDFYHAGLDTDERSRKQESWIRNETRIIVSTNAFGMGIDKADVRFVVHLDLPESLEAYYQEAGRGGRDEKKAYAILLYTEADRIQLLQKLERSFPSIEEIRQTYHQLGNYFQIAYGAGEDLTFEFDIAGFCSRFKLDVLKTLNTLKFLEHDGYITVTESVFLPSRLKIIVAPEDLYRFQIEYASFDPFIKMLLRSYGGLYDQYTQIRESDIAKRLGISFRMVVDMLAKLESLELVSYLPQTDKPQINFTKSRVDSTNLVIDHKYLKERKQIMHDQITSVIAYANTSKCRSRQLLEYFDDHSSENCGVCDVCLEEKRKERTLFLEDNITNEILNILSEKPLALDNLIASITAGNERERVETLRNLLDAGKVKTDGANYYI